MSKENSFEEWKVKYEAMKEEFKAKIAEETINKKVIEGEGFTMKKGEMFSRNESPSLQFRPGETSETAREREKMRKEQLKKEDFEQENKMTPEEREEKRARLNRDLVAGWFKDLINKKGEYSETLMIEEDGNFNREKRFDDKKVPFIITAGLLEKKEDLYRLMQAISLEYPQFDISFDIDPAGRWIKYRVTKKLEN